MERLTKYLGPHYLDTVIARSFRQVDLNRCSRLPVVELEFYEKLVTCFPEHQTFIAGGFASFAMGYTSDFSNVNMYVICETYRDAGQIYGQLEDWAQKMRNEDINIRFNRSSPDKIDCEEYGLSVYRFANEARRIFDFSINVVLCVIQPQPDVGKLRYIDTLEVVMLFDMFQSMCIIDSIDLANKRCSALAVHQYRHAVADTDMRYSCARRNRDYCMAIFRKTRITKTKFYADREWELWLDIIERCSKYKSKTPKPNLTISVPSLSSLCLSVLINDGDERQDLTKYYLRDFAKDHTVKWW